MSNREMVGKEIWGRLLKAENGKPQNLYLATYSLDQGVLWWIARECFKGSKGGSICCVYDGSRLRRWQQDRDDREGDGPPFKCMAARTENLYHPKVIIVSCGNEWKALIGTGNLSLGESDQERNFGVLIETAVSGANAPNDVTKSLQQLAGNIGLPLRERAGADRSAIGSRKPSSCFLVVKRCSGGYQVRCEKTSLTKLFKRLFSRLFSRPLEDKHVDSPDSPNGLCVVICSPFGISGEFFKVVFRGKVSKVQLFTREDAAPQSFPVQAHVHHPVGRTGLHGKLVFVAADDRNTKKKGDGILFIGSANFTRKAWGEAGNENVETGVMIVDKAEELKKVAEYLLRGSWTCKSIKSNGTYADCGTNDEDYAIDSESENEYLHANILKRHLLQFCLRIKKDKIVVVKEEVPGDKHRPQYRIVKRELFDRRTGKREVWDAQGNYCIIPYLSQDWELRIRLKQEGDAGKTTWLKEYSLEIPLCAVRGAEKYFGAEDWLAKLVYPGGRYAVGGGGKRRQPAKNVEPYGVTSSDDVRFPWGELLGPTGKRMNSIRYDENYEKRLREEAEMLAATAPAKQPTEKTGYPKYKHAAGSTKQRSPRRSYQKYQSHLKMYIIKKVLDVGKRLRRVAPAGHNAHEP